MKQTEYKVYPFRWLLLVIILPIIIASEIFWLSFAPISSALIKDHIYSVGTLGIDLFSMSYMLMYIAFMVPASWVIDKYGFKASLLIGAALTVVFGITRFIFSGNYTLALVSQFLLAAGQPFLVNVSTKVPANWFPVKERSTAAGLLIMAQYIGFIVPMVASPMLYDSYGLKTMLGVYAAFAVLAAILVFFTKEKPPVPPGPEAPKEMMSMKNVMRLMANKNYLWVLIVSFISMGLFNTLMTKLEGILSPRGFSSGDAGIVMAVFVVTGIAGAVLVPLFSDKIGRRVPLFIAGIALLGPLCLGLTFFGSMPLLLVTAAALGFLIMGLAPVLFQHGAEVAYPVPEGTSFGFVMLAGQISGVAFVFLFDVIHGNTASMLAPMLFLVVVAVIQVPITLLMKESEIFKSSNAKEALEETV
jgi:MFS transporter, FLVCR family, MFS-domain-containing protein 7